MTPDKRDDRYSLLRAAIADGRVDPRPKKRAVCGTCKGQRRVGNIVCWTCRGRGLLLLVDPSSEEQQR